MEIQSNQGCIRHEKQLDNTYRYNFHSKPMQQISKKLAENSVTTSLRHLYLSNSSMQIFGKAYIINQVTNHDFPEQLNPDIPIINRYSLPIVPNYRHYLLKKDISI